MNAPSPSAVLARNERTAWRVLDTGTVIFFPEAGTLHQLNRTATRVWEHLDGRRTLADIAVALTDEFNVDAEMAAEQIAALAGELLAVDLVIDVHAPADELDAVSDIGNFDDFDGVIAETT